jgi:hypothetical protein
VEVFGPTSTQGEMKSHSRILLYPLGMNHAQKTSPLLLCGVDHTENTFPLLLCDVTVHALTCLVSCCLAMCHNLITCNVQYLGVTMPKQN